MLEIGAPEDSALGDRIYNNRGLKEAMPLHGPCTDEQDGHWAPRGASLLIGEVHHTTDLPAHAYATAEASTEKHL